MNLRLLLFSVACAMSATFASAAVRTSPSYSVPAEVLDAGGRGASSGSYSGAGSIGTIAGASASPTYQAQAGFNGQVGDTITATPILNAPAPDSTFAGLVAIDYSLSEAAANGTVKLIFTGSVTTTLTLINAQGTPGAHSFNLQSDALAATSEVANVDGPNALADGIYTVTLSYQDAFSNPAASATNANITIYSALTPAGYYSVTGYGPGIPAPAGSYVANAGSTQATLCEPGYYTDAPASTAQIPAPAGNYVPNFGATQATLCDPGYYTNLPASTAAIPAPAGSYVSIAGATSATLCDPGYYTDLPARIAQIPAPAGSYVSIAGATSATLCDPGYYTDLPASSAAIPAPPGSYVSIAGATHATLCDPGYYTELPASTAPIPAPAGSYVANAGETHATLCNRGYYTDTPASTAPIPSPANFYAPVVGATSATPNPPGTWSHVASVATRSLTAPVDHVIVVSPVYVCDQGNGGTIALGPITAATEVAFHITNGSHDLGFADPLTDLGLVATPITGADLALVGVTTTPAGNLHEGAATLFKVTVSPGTTGAHSAVVSVVTDEGNVPGLSGVAHDYTITWSVASVNPVHDVRYTKGQPVPGAGSGGIPTGAVWTGFGVPAVNDAGAVAYLGKWKSPTGNGAGIFVDDTLVTRTGGTTPELGAAIFKALRDPVLDGAGHVAFIATVAGTGVTPVTDTVLATNSFGALAVVARESGPTAEVGSPLFKTFKSISLVDGEVLFAARLQGGSPTVTSANDDAAFRVASLGSLAHVVREGDTLGASTVKSFKLLAAVTGSPGQNRGHAVGTATFLAVLADGTKAVVDSTGGTLDPLVMTGDTTGGVALPAAKFKSFGAPASDGARLAFLATLSPGLDGVTSKNAKGIFKGEVTGIEPVARLGQITGVGATTFGAFKDPVLAPGADSVAFPATLGGTTSADNASLWWQPAGGSLTLLARKSAQPPEVPAGAGWKAFASLALPGGATGPLFLASLQRDTGGVDATNDIGVWGVDSTGALRLLFREGDSIGGKAIKSFLVLKAVSGSPGVTRAFNNHGQVVWRAAFVDGSTAIIVSQVP